MAPITDRGKSGRPRVAIAHDYLTQRGGAEKVVLAMSRAFPEAPIYTLLYEPDETFEEFRGLDIRVSPLNAIGPLRRRHRTALPLLPFASRRMRIDADLLLTSSSGWAHGFRTTGAKLVFCHSPAHWLYSANNYLGPNSGRMKRTALRALSGSLRSWDRRAAATCDRYLANSMLTRERIADVYGIEAEIVHPPVPLPPDTEAVAVPEVEEWLAATAGSDQSFFLSVSRLLPYKNVAAVAEAFGGLPHRLVIVGQGPEEQRVREALGENTILVSDLSEGQMAWLYQRSRALVTASYEDYGLTPLEAASWGKPTIALRFGGFLETIEEGVTGLYFNRPEPAAIQAAVAEFERSAFDEEAIKRHLERFSEDRFAATLHAIVDEMAPRQ